MIQYTHVMQPYPGITKDHVISCLSWRKWSRLPAVLDSY